MIAFVHIPSGSDLKNLHITNFFTKINLFKVYHT